MRSKKDTILKIVVGPLIMMLVFALSAAPIASLTLRLAPNVQTHQLFRIFVGEFALLSLVTFFWARGWWYRFGVFLYSLIMGGMLLVIRIFFI